MSLDEPEHKRVLVVEDNPRLRATVRELLHWEGYQVDEAAHGLEALAVAADTRPDVIVTDLQMPVMDGATFIQQCRELPGLDGIPIVVMSAEAAPDTALARLPAGQVRVYLEKPFSLEELTTAIEKSSAATLSTR
jgi:two-component system, chemotaxis family, chemotaxis protein CheY